MDFLCEYVFYCCVWCPGVLGGAGCESGDVGGAW